MSGFISTLVAILTYIVLFNLFFEDFDDFIEKLKGTLYFFPIALILDYFLNWSPSFSKMSLRVLIWLPSGFFVGIMTYIFIEFIKN
jgi:hypothetical protein